MDSPEKMSVGSKQIGEKELLRILGGGWCNGWWGEGAGILDGLMTLPPGVTSLIMLHSSEMHDHVIW